MIKSLTLTLVLLSAAVAADSPRLEFDHLWIMVSAGAPERAALERAGFQISPDVNRHEGQGTSSVTAEFQNAYIELMWLDAAVPVAAGMERGVEKFRQRTQWRTSGWCPIGIGFHRTGDSKETLPFPTWSVTAAWLPAGSSIEMLTPRDDTHSPSLFIAPKALTDASEQAARASRYHQAEGAQRITSVRLLSPRTYQPIDALAYLTKQKALEAGQDKEWLVEVTFDGGKKKKSKDLRPDLPLVVRF